MIPKKEYLITGIIITLLVCSGTGYFFNQSTIAGLAQVSDSSNESDKGFHKSDNPIMHLSIDEEKWLPIIPPEPVERTLDAYVEQGMEILVYDVKTKKTKEIPKNPTKPDKTTLMVPGSKGSLPSELVPETVFDPDDRVRITPTIDYPWRTICKLFITAADGTHFVGSGVIVDGFHILTAGHCVYMHDYGGWVSSIDVVPAFDDGYAPFWHAWATNYYVYANWTILGRYTHDFAMLTMDRNVGSCIGSMGIMTATPSSSAYTDTLYTAGYPGDLDDGWCMYYDSDYGVGADYYNHWFYMDTYGGQSGSPVWCKRNYPYVGCPFVLSIVTYGESYLWPGSNMGTRLNGNIFHDILIWFDSDVKPIDYANLVDDGQYWSGFDPVTVIAGVSNFDVWSDIRNIGTKYSGTFSVSYYASIDTEITTSDYLIGIDEVTSISPFRWKDSDCNGTIFPDIPAGTYYVGWIIDSDDDVEEFVDDVDDGETDNVAYKDSYQLNVLGIPPDMGTLSISTTPVDGEVFVDGISWGTAPQSQEVEVGSYTVSYGAMEGYTTPIDEVAVVTVDATTEVIGTYVLIPPDMGILSIDTTPVKGEVFVDGVSWGIAPQSQEVEVGSHTVSYGTMAGYITPSAIEIVITVDATTQVLGIYTRIPESELTIDYIMTTDYVERDWGDYGDTMVVLGSGATVGGDIYLYWDSVMYWDGEKGILNSTTGDPDGSFEVWFDVPKSINGIHYLWIKDVDCDHTYGPVPFTVNAMLMLTPSSGLIGDNIIIKGYGFTDEEYIVTITFNEVDLETNPSLPQTDNLGSWEATFNVPDLDGGKYEVYAEDAEGIFATKDFTIHAASSNDIILYEGWNLIGLPFTPEDPSIEVVLDEILDYVICVWAYDGETKTWSCYSPGAPIFLTEMIVGRGYWIKVDANVILHAPAKTFKTWTGSASRNTELFYVPVNQIKITWDLVTDEYSLFAIFLYEEGADYYTDCWTSLEEQPQGETYAYISPGYYYLDFTVYGCNYTVTVEW